jgi:hypothetical protein
MNYTLEAAPITNRYPKKGRLKKKFLKKWTTKTDLYSRESSKLRMNWMYDLESQCHVNVTNLGKQELPEIVTLEIEIPSDAKMTLIGTVSQIVENMAIVQAHVSGDYQVLDADSILISKDRKPIGKVSCCKFLK